MGQGVLSSVDIYFADLAFNHQGALGAVWDQGRGKSCKVRAGPTNQACLPSPALACSTSVEKHRASTK